MLDRHPEQLLEVDGHGDTPLDVARATRADNAGPRHCKRVILYGEPI